MAVAKEDYWVIVAGLGAVAAGYWYFTKNKAANDVSSGSSTSSTSTDSSPTIDTTATNANELIQSYDASSVGSTTPNQLYNPGVSVTTPSGYTVNTMSQTLPIPVNS
jgi:cytoskeletal protein RodZ